LVAVASGLEVLAPNDTRWMRFIEGHRDATVFHHPAWAELLVEAYRYRPSLLAQLDARGHIAVGIPVLEVHSRMTGRRLVSLPFTDHCPPLSRDERDLANFATALVRWQQAHALPAIDVHGTLPAVPGVRQVSVGVRHILSLEQGSERLRSGFHQSVRQRIKRAARDGLTARIGSALDDVEVFYRLHWTTRRRLGVPLQPRRFFDLLWRRIISQGLGFFVVVENAGSPIAANLFLGWNRNLIGKYSASDSRYWQLGPNNLMLWTGMLAGVERGYRSFDFGKSDLSNRGLRSFKSSFGSIEVPLDYAAIGDVPARAGSGLASRILAQVIRRSPPLVCRVSGELLYGHFA
jgi:CelD/BcsL family acetyltransferase involved in cellulose biosynthesis